MSVEKEVRYIRIEASHESYYDYDDHQTCGGVNLNSKEMTESELLDELFAKHNKTLLKQNGYLKVSKDYDEQSRSILEQNGWINIKDIKSREEKKILLQKYYITKLEGSAPYKKYLLSEINIDKISDYDINRLAKGESLVQIVSPESVLNDSKKKVYRSYIQAESKRAERKKMSEEKKQQRKKMKEIEKARKILQTHGIIENGKT